MRRFLYRGAEVFELHTSSGDFSRSYGVNGVAPEREVEGGETPLSRDPAELTTVRFKVLHERTGHPVESVKLVVDLPSGERRRGSTGADGIYEITGVPEGVCEVTSDLDAARLTNTWSFKGLGAGTPTAAGGTTGAEADDSDGALRIARIEERKVRTGDTLESIAGEAAMPWQDLATFNWGTSDPREVNRHLYEDVGCTKLTEDRQNHVFDDSDNPGLVYIPRPFKQSNLETGVTHIFRIQPVTPFLVLLENEAGLRIPEAEFEAVLADESKVSGKLGKNGIRLIKDPPPGEVQIEFTDLDDVEAKSLAACVRKSFDERNPQEVYRLLHHSPDMIEAAIDRYGKYYDDFSGKGLVEDICQEITDPVALDAVLGLLVFAEVLTEEEASSRRKAD